MLLEVSGKNQLRGLEFVSAGDAIFTVSNNKGDRYTYRINRSKTKEECKRCGGSGEWVNPRDPADVRACWCKAQNYFAKLLTGPDNTSSYTYLGLVDFTKEVPLRMTAASKMTADSIPVKVLNWVLIMLRAGKDLPEGYSVRHAGRCGKCGRVLTVPESIDQGIGPECQKQLSGVK